MEQRDGRMPESLETLAKAGLLARLPIYSFDGNPLRYSATQRLLWSAGANARDDGGVAGEGEDEGDLVWRPTLLTTAPGS